MNKKAVGIIEEKVIMCWECGNIPKIYNNCENCKKLIEEKMKKD